MSGWNRATSADASSRPQASLSWISASTLTTRSHRRRQHQRLPILRAVTATNKGLRARISRRAAADAALTPGSRAGGDPDPRDRATV
jgi:hypothetical protein